MSKSSDPSSEFLKPRGARIAGLVGLFAIALFIFIAAEVAREGALTLLDVRLNNWLHNHRTPALITLLRFVSTMHSNWIATLLSGVIAVYLWTKRLRYWVLSFAISVLGGMLLNVRLKLLFARPRAHFDDPILVLHTFSFPSGHTMLATVFYGTLCVLAVTRTRKKKVRAAVILLAVFMIALVGFSRMYLGVHYLTDVVGAMAEGAAWISLSLLLVIALRAVPTRF